VDLLASKQPRVKLTADDSYRLVLEMMADRHVYVYQRAPRGEIELLYPNAGYSLVENPIRAADTVYLPDVPNGFYVESREGLYRLYVVAAEGAMSELETLNLRSSRPGIQLGRRKRAMLLVERLDALVGGQIEGARGWAVEFEFR
jgi:hypothetical protein